MLIENRREADEKMHKNQDLQQQIIPNLPQIKLLDCGMYQKCELNYINFYVCYFALRFCIHKWYGINRA